MLNILVCVKQVIDPECSVSSFKIDDLGQKVIPPQGTVPVLSPFDENALEAALKIKDEQPTKITVLSMGPSLAKPVLLKAAAVGADEVILLEDPNFVNIDSFATAGVLAQAIKKINEYDVICCGRQAADTDAGLVGPGIAETLGIPLITLAQKIEARGDKLLVEQVTSDGYNVMEATLPVLITVGNEVGELRYPKTKDLLAAKKKKPLSWDAESLEVDAGALAKIELVDMCIPNRKANCKMINGASPEEVGIKLAIQLKEDEVI